jgi:hypothetical protein
MELHREFLTKVAGNNWLLAQKRAKFAYKEVVRKSPKSADGENGKSIGSNNANVEIQSPFSM